MECGRGQAAAFRGSEERRSGATDDLQSFATGGGRGRRGRIASWFEKFFSEQCRVLPVTEEIARRAGDLRGRLRAKGETRSQADRLIAATALAHRLTLVTRHEGDFEDSGVIVLNPFA